MSKECKIIGSISAQMSKFTTITPDNKVLIGIEGHSIFKYCLVTKRKFRLAGSIYGKGYIDGNKNESKFNTPKGLVLSKDGSVLYVSDSKNHRIRKISLKTYITSTITIICDYPNILKLSVCGDILYVSGNNIIQEIDLLTHQTKTIVVCDNNINAMEINPNGKDILFGTPVKWCKIDIDPEKLNTFMICKQFPKIVYNYTISSNFQYMFLTTNNDKYITVLNIEDYSDFYRINLDFEPKQITVSLDNNLLYIVQTESSDIIIVDISNIVKDFKILFQSLIYKYSHLSREAIKRLLI